jgi:hypothetical protein
LTGGIDTAPNVLTGGIDTAFRPAPIVLTGGIDTPEPNAVAAIGLTDWNIFC